VATVVVLFAAAGIATGFELTNVAPLESTADNLGGAPSALSLDGATLVAGTRSTDGLVTVFENAGGWNRAQVLPPPTAGKGFGEAVDVFGDVLAAADQTSSTRDGAVHVFRKTGTWQSEQTISQPTAGDFGHSVALRGGQLAIGAPHWVNPGGSVINPAVFLYDFDGANWVPNGFLQPSSAQTCGPTSFFGFDVDMVGNVLVVGAASDAIDSCPAGTSSGEGSISVWVDSSGSWTQSAPRLRASDPDPDDRFGFSVATTGSAVLVGAPFDDEVGTNSGAAYLFELVDGAWTETRKLTAADGILFGSSVAIADTGAGLRIVVGSDSTNAVYVFERGPNGSWTETRIDLAGLGYPPGNFGQSVAADGSLVAIGGVDMDPQAFVIDSPVVVPQPVDDTYSMVEDATLSAVAGGTPPGVLDNDSDPAGSGLVAGLVTDVANGTLGLTPDGSFTYHPGAGFSGMDSFVYEACDDQGFCSRASATIDVVSDEGPPSAGDFITRDGATLLHMGEAFTFTGVNIYNANSDGACGSEVDLERAIDDIGPGKKVLRAWFFQNMATESGSRDWTRFDQTLATAEAHGLKVIPVLANQWRDCEVGLGFKPKGWYEDGYRTTVDPEGTVSYRAWVEEIVHRYRNNSTVAFWQLINEAEVQDVEGGNCDDVVDPASTLGAWAEDVADLIKSVDSNHLVSLGTIGGGQCGTQEEEYQEVHDIASIDLCEYHDYTPNDPLPGDEFNGLLIRLSQCDALDKPLFVGEAGINPEDVGGTLDDRAMAFAVKLTAQFEAGVKGFLAWAYTGGPSAVDDYDIGAGDPILEVLAMPVNRSPQAVDDQFGLRTNSAADLDVLANDTDPDLDPLIVVNTQNPSTRGGQADCPSTTSCSYTSPADFVGADTFTYTLSDQQGGFDTATVTVTLDRPPTIESISDVSMDEGGSAVVEIQAADPDGDPVVVSVSGLPDFGGFDSDSLEISLTPGSDDSGTYGPVTVSVDDGNGDPVSTDFSITVVEVSSPVELRIGDTNAVEGSALVFNLALSAPMSTGLKVDYVTNPVSATSPEDFQQVSGTVIIPSGSVGATIPIPTVNDRVLEPVETMTVSISSSGVTIADAIGVGTILPDGDICTIVGTAANENLVGTDGDDVICGGLGDDIIDGLGGNDILFGEGGNDILRGGSGDDRFHGGSGVDRASFALAPRRVNVSLASGTSSGEGNDTLSSIEDLFGSEFSDIIRGNGGPNQLWGNGGSDDLYGLAGDDPLLGGAGNDNVYGGGGNDVLFGNDGNDQLKGEGGDDTLSGNEGRDTLIGGAGDDNLSGGEDADRIQGSGGNDTLVGGPSPTQSTVDSLDGGAGTDACFSGGGREDRKQRCEDG
jgi:Ca2+-binding RTX toxin-like protein